MKLLVLFFCAIWLESALGRAKHEKADLGIVNGQEAVPHSIPWQVYLDLIDSNNNLYMSCGGALISKNYVLTAAHCLTVAPNNDRNNKDPKNDLKVVKAFVLLGAHNATVVEPTQQEFLSQHLKVHEQWNLENFTNDIALIKLPQPAQLTNSVKTIALSTLSSKQLVGRTGTVSGWGLESINSQQYPDNLRKAQIRIAENSACNSVAPPFNAATYICSTGPKNRGACVGDSGGPLTVDGKLAGLVSFGSPNCKPSNKDPSAFTRISYYIDWIKKNTDL